MLIESIFHGFYWSRSFAITEYYKLAVFLRQVIAKELPFYYFKHNFYMRL